MKRYDIVVVGEIYIDHVLTGFEKWPQPGEEVYAQNYAQDLGGGAAITGCALAKLGHKVSLIGTIGKSECEWIGQKLAGFGVLRDGLRCLEGRTGTTISVSSRAERSFFSYLGANTHLEDQLADEKLIEQMMQARHVHFAMPITADLATALLERLGGSSTISLDVGHHAAWLSDAANLAVCAQIDYLLPNEREARMICEGDALAYLEFTRRQNWPSGVVKLGAGGAVMRGDREPLLVRPPEVNTIDTTGAGDAFNGGFIDGLLKGANDIECLRRGCVVGGLSTRSAGALGGLPTREELEKSLRECYG